MAPAAQGLIHFPPLPSPPLLTANPFTVNTASPPQPPRCPDRKPAAGKFRIFASRIRWAAPPGFRARGTPCGCALWCVSRLTKAKVQPLPELHFSTFSPCRPHSLPRTCRMCGGRAVHTAELPRAVAFLSREVSDLGIAGALKFDLKLLDCKRASSMDEGVRRKS